MPKYRQGTCNGTELTIRKDPKTGKERVKKIEYKDCKVASQQWFDDPLKLTDPKDIVRQRNMIRDQINDLERDEDFFTSNNQSTKQIGKKIGKLKDYTDVLWNQYHDLTGNFITDDPSSK